MGNKRIRSEYMKKFKDPKWETYTKCYEEMLKYRLTRRLLEHTHNPWFWSGSDTDSDSGGRSPIPPSKNQVQAESGRERTEAELEECEGARMSRTTGPVPRLPLQEEEEEEPVPVRGKIIHRYDSKTVQHIGVHAYYFTIPCNAIPSSQAHRLKLPEKQLHQRRRERSREPAAEAVNS